jgi:hypothetical protein
LLVFATPDSEKKTPQFVVTTIPLLVEVLSEVRYLVDPLLLKLILLGYTCFGASLKLDIQTGA